MAGRMWLTCCRSSHADRMEGKISIFGRHVPDLVRIARDRVEGGGPGCLVDICRTAPLWSTT